MNRTKTISILGGVAAVGVLAFFLTKTPSPAPSQAASAPVATTSTPPGFTKEGEVSFVRKNTNETIKRIDVEIADNDAERSKGLMYRSTMPDSLGMLFIFEGSEPQSFWMKNTLISLDIIYVDENKTIVTIQPNTKPLSEDPIPSYRNAQYVVEVVAGFCERHGIKEGDKVVF